MPRKRPAELPSLFEGFSYEGKQGNVTSLLDGGGDHALMAGTCAGLATRADLAIFSNVLPKHICFLVVNRQGFICTELTKFRLREKAAFSARSFGSPLGSSIFSHLLLQFLVEKSKGLADVVLLINYWATNSIYLEWEFILVRCHFTII